MTRNVPEHKTADEGEPQNSELLLQIPFSRKFAKELARQRRVASTSCKEEAARTCYACDSRPAVFRLMELRAEGSDTEGNELPAGAAFMLTCRECAVRLLGDAGNELARNISSEGPLFGLMLLPLQLTGQQMEELGSIAEHEPPPER